MSLDRSTSVREVDGLGLIFIGFHVPVITPRLYCSDSEIISLITVCCIYTCVILKES